MKSPLAPLLLALCTTALAEEGNVTAPPREDYPSVWAPTTGLRTQTLDPGASISQAICGYGYSADDCTVTVTVDKDCKVTIDKLIVNFEADSKVPVFWKLSGPENFEFRQDSIVIDESNTNLVVSKPYLDSVKSIHWKRVESISGTLHKTPKIAYFYTVNVYKNGEKKPCGVVDPLIISHG